MNIFPYQWVLLFYLCWSSEQSHKAIGCICFVFVIYPLMFYLRWSYLNLTKNGYIVTIMFCLCSENQLVLRHEGNDVVFAEGNSGSLWWGSNSRLTGLGRLRVRRATHCATLPQWQCKWCHQWMKDTSLLNYSNIFF